MVLKNRGIIISGLSLAIIIGSLTYKINTLNNEKRELENKIIKIEKNIENANEKIDDLNGQIKEKDKELKTLNKELNVAISKYEEIEKENKKLKSENKSSNETKTSNVSAKTSNVATARTGYNISSKEVELLEKLVYREAGIEPQEGQIAVANVVLNRVNSDSFPDTITDVIYQKGQFQPVDNGDINDVEPSDEVKVAVQKALRGEKVISDDTVYFFATYVRSNHPIRSHVEITKTIGGHHFGKWV